MKLGMAFDYFSHGDLPAVRTLSDFGVVHRGSMLGERYEASLAIDQQGDVLLVRISVSSQQGDQPRSKQTITWPYSRGDAGVLCPVLTDLATLQDERNGKAHVPARSATARFTKRLLRLEGLASFQLTSVIDQMPAVGVLAEIVQVGPETLVTLTQQRKGRRVARIQLPPMAFAPMSRKLRELMMTTNPVATTRRYDYDADPRRSGQLMQDLPTLETPEMSFATMSEPRDFR